MYYNVLGRVSFLGCRHSKDLAKLMKFKYKGFVVKADTPIKALIAVHIICHL